MEWYMAVPPLVTVQPLGICRLKSAVSYSSVSMDLAAVSVIFTSFSSFVMVPSLLTTGSFPPGCPCPAQPARESASAAASSRDNTLFFFIAECLLIDFY